MPELDEVRDKLNERGYQMKVGKGIGRIDAFDDEDEDDEDL